RHAERQGGGRSQQPPDLRERHAADRNRAACGSAGQSQCERAKRPAAEPRDAHGDAPLRSQLPVQGAPSMKAMKIVLFLVSFAALSGCVAPPTVKSPCVGAAGSPCERVPLSKEAAEASA